MAFVNFVENYFHDEKGKDKQKEILVKMRLFEEGQIPPLDISECPSPSKKSSTSSSEALSKPSSQRLIQVMPLPAYADEDDWQCWMHFYSRRKQLSDQKRTAKALDNIRGIQDIDEEKDEEKRKEVRKIFEQEPRKSAQAALSGWNDFDAKICGDCDSGNMSQKPPELEKMSPTNPYSHLIRSSTSSVAGNMRRHLFALNRSNMELVCCSLYGTNQHFAFDPDEMVRGKESLWTGPLNTDSINNKNKQSNKISRPELSKEQIFTLNKELLAHIEGKHVKNQMMKDELDDIGCPVAEPAKKVAFGDWNRKMRPGGQRVQPGSSSRIQNLEEFQKEEELRKIIDADKESGNPLFDFYEAMDVLVPDLALKVMKRFGMAVKDGSEKEHAKRLDDEIGALELIRFRRMVRDNPNFEAPCPPGCFCE